MSVPKQTPVAPPTAPTIDDTAKTAALVRNQQDRRFGRGSASTVLTSETGLPDLGTTRTPSAGNGMYG